MPGRLVVISGSSGSGKSTLIRRALELPDVDARFSISCTTRAPRQGEVDGVHYRFCTRDDFQTGVDHGDFLEWAEFAGNCYGTPIGPVQEALAAGQTILLEIEVVGAIQVKERIPAAFLVWIDPPSFDVLEARLRARRTDSDDAIARRLDRARWEATQVDCYDQRILNDDVDRAAAELAVLFRPAPEEA